jgi:dimethylargininase
VPSSITTLTRPVPLSLDHCQLTHLTRAPIDVARAAAQHQCYEDLLRALGCRIRRLPRADDLPDSVFVEDVAVVLDEVAIVTRPGAVSRRPERDAMAAVLAEYRPVQTIMAPGTMDGGDVLRVGTEIYVGLSTRTNDDAAQQLAGIAEPLGYAVRTIRTTACLHLKSAATALGPDRVLCNPAWIDPQIFSCLDVVPIDPDEPPAGNVLRVGDTIVSAAAFPRTIARLRAEGYRVCPVDVSELAKAEAGVTCCSVMME